jgi:hypothetical protein
VGPTLQIFYTPYSLSPHSFSLLPPPPSLRQFSSPPAPMPPPPSPSPARQLYPTSGSTGPRRSRIRARRLTSLRRRGVEAAQLSSVAARTSSGLVEARRGWRNAGRRASALCVLDLLWVEQPRLEGRGELQRRCLPFPCSLPSNERRPHHESATASSIHLQRR